MSEEGPCCGFKKKTVVMTTIGLCCLMLVVWTIVITANNPTKEEKALNGVANITTSPMMGVCPLNSTLSLENVSIALTMPKIGTLPSLKKIKIGAPKAHCKCLCQYNVTETEIIEALQEVRKLRKKENKQKN